VTILCCTPAHGLYGHAPDNRIDLTFSELVLSEKYNFIASTFSEEIYQYEDTRRTLLSLSSRTIVWRPANTKTNWHSALYQKLSQGKLLDLQVPDDCRSHGSSERHFRVCLNYNG
jgi:hypothetical protein